VEVDLVAALPAQEPVETPEVPPEPEPEMIPPPPEPMPEPPPEPEKPPELEKPPEMTLPEPPPEPPPVQQPPPPEKPKPRPESKPKPTPRVAAKVSGDGSAPVPGTSSISRKRTTGGESAKPAYLRNPHPVYPEESRRLRQQGVVHLRVAVNEKGVPTSVVLSRSSGFPLLDERALTTVRDRWKFRAPRVDGVPVSTSVIIPIRFELN
jgi:protein TonB